MTNPTPYDDVFKTLTADCTQLLIPLVNEIFGESFTEDEIVERLPNEHYTAQQGAQTKEKITDSYFIIGRYIQKKYHIECQSTPDGSMIVRMFEYDSQIALDDAKVNKHHLIVSFPHSAVLYLRHYQSTPDNMTVTFQMPDGNFNYIIPIVKVQHYTLDEIFQKKLLFLLPFHIFCYEAQLDEYENDASKRQQLISEYTKIRKHLEMLCDLGNITEYTKLVLLELSQKVIDNLADKQKMIKKEVEHIMGGKVIETQARKMLNQGRKEGLREGKREGLRAAYISLIQDGELSIEKGAQRLGISVDELQKYIQNQN